MRNARQAVNQTNFNGELLAQTKISVPSLDTQLDIIAKLEEEIFIVKQNKRLIAIFEQKIEDKISEIWGEKQWAHDHLQLYLMQVKLKKL